MVTVDVSDGSVLLKFQGRRGPTTNKLSAAEAEELIADIEAALVEIQEDGRE